MRKVLRAAVALAGVALLVGFALFVSPTPYRWDHISVYEGQSAPVRINRFTGRAEMLLPWRGEKHRGGWVLLGNEPRSGYYLAFDLDDLIASSPPPGFRLVPPSP